MEPTRGQHKRPDDMLCLLTWNIGCLTDRSAQLFAILLTTAPHIVLLQDARLPAPLFRGLCASLREIGYLCESDADRGLLAILRRGLNFAPLSKRSDEWRCRDYALQLPGKARVTVRNIHAPIGGSSMADRKALFDVCEKEITGDLHILAGDFNQMVPGSATAVPIIPGAPTFRRSADTEWITAIDGARASPLLGRDAYASLPRYHGDAQHRPVRLVFNTAPVTHGFLCWVRKKPEAARWTDDLRSRFHTAALADIDAA